MRIISSLLKLLSSFAERATLTLFNDAQKTILTLQSEQKLLLDKRTHAYMKKLTKIYGRLGDSSSVDSEAHFIVETCTEAVTSMIAETKVNALYGLIKNAVTLHIHIYIYISELIARVRLQSFVTNGWIYSRLRFGDGIISFLTFQANM
jgi:hypothetical protein